MNSSSTGSTTPSPNKKEGIAPLNAETKRTSNSLWNLNYKRDQLHQAQLSTSKLFLSCSERLHCH